MPGPLAFCTSLWVVGLMSLMALGKQPGNPTIPVPRFETAKLPDGALARCGTNRFTLVRPLEGITFGKDGKEIQGWDGQTLYHWEFPSGRPLQRWNLPDAVNPTGLPLAHTALCPHHPQVAWLLFHKGKEYLQVWDFPQKQLVLNCEVTLEGKRLDYADLLWSDDGKKLLAILNDKRAHVYNRDGKLIDQKKVVFGKHHWKLPSGNRLCNSGYYQPGLLVRRGRARIQITFEPQNREVKRDIHRKLRPHLLVFKHLDSGKSESVQVVPDLVHPTCATVSKDGRHLALFDDSRLRIWDVDTRRELRFPTALPNIHHMVVSPGGTYIQFQRDRFPETDPAWHSLHVASGQMRRLETPSPGGITIGLGVPGFAVGKDQFIGITGRSVDRWDLKTGRRLDGTPLPKTPHEKEFGVGYDECLLLQDGFSLVQFASFQTRHLKSKNVYQSTWRVWSPGTKKAAFNIIPDCTWQRGAAVLPHRRFLYFATPPEQPRSQKTELVPGVTFLQRGDLQLYFGQLDSPHGYRMAAFGGQWSQLRGVSHGGQLLLLSTSSSNWIPVSRHSQMTWFDPAAQRHCLLEFHSGQAVGDRQKLSKLIRDRASYLSADGQFLLIAQENQLLLYEPHVLGKIVKVFPLPATPRRFAVSKDGSRIACQLDDATLMIWDGEHFSRIVNAALIRECPKNLNMLVSRLASSPTSALRAARLLAVAGEAGVAALAKAMDGRKPDARQIAGWIRDLDSDVFATRKKAESSLAEWGKPVEKSLRDARKVSRSAEMRMRLQRLLSRLTHSPYGSRELAQARAVLALQWSRSPAAAKLLAQWAKQFPESVLGIESRGALAIGPGR